MGGEPTPRTSPGRPVTPRPAASVILVRGGAATLEVLLLQRAPTLRFMGGAWVFPGGSVDPGDHPEGVEGPEAVDLAHRAAAVREAAEEAGVALPGTQGLVPFSRWVTPADRPMRFDCRFFLAAAPEGQEARADGIEMVQARWMAPARAVAAGARGELRLPTPTRSQLAEMAAFASVEALLAWAAGRRVAAIEPPAGTPDLDGPGAER
jgi:8-oxo-dGTP pyrophosphatase MutT (NUDIX family)